MPIRHYVFNLKLDVTKEQDQALRQNLGNGRFFYNFCLEWAKNDYAEFLEEVDSRLIWGEAKTKEEATALSHRVFYANKWCYSAKASHIRKEFDFLKVTPVSVFQARAMDLSKAFNAFYKQGYGFPKFKCRFVNRSIRYPGNRSYVYPERHTIQLSMLGEIKYRGDYAIQDHIVNVTVKLEADGWHAYVLTSKTVPEPPTFEEIIDRINLDKIVALDVGVKHFCATSDGELIDLPFSPEAMDQKISDARKHMAHAVKGSNRYNKRMEHLRKLYLDKTNQIKTFQDTLIHQLVSKYDIIVVEDINLRSLTRSAHGTVDAPGKHVAQKAGTNKSMLSRAFGRFFTELQSHMNQANKLLLFVWPNNSSITCHACGRVDAKSRKSQSHFECPCGYTDNADINAAKNLLDRGRLFLEELFAHSDKVDPQSKLRSVDYGLTYGNKIKAQGNGKGKGKVASTPKAQSTASIGSGQGVAQDQQAPLKPEA